MASTIEPTPRIFDASLTPSEIRFQSHVYDRLLDPIAEDLVYTHVPQEWVDTVWKHIEDVWEHRSFRNNYNLMTETLWIRKMPTFIHNICLNWMSHALNDWTLNGLLTMDETFALQVSVADTIEFKSGPYTGSRKEPDFLLTPFGEDLPTFVIESGWSESVPRLRDDMNLWLVGGNGTVKAVMIIKWSLLKSTNGVTGTAKFYTNDTQGMPVLQNEFTIFPRPQDQEQTLQLTRRMLFGNRVRPGTNPNDAFPLRLNDLRRVVTEPLHREGLVPAF